MANVDRFTCPNGHPLVAGATRCARCEDAAEARRELELADRYPREWSELDAALDALVGLPKGSARRRRADERVERALARWREVEAESRR